MVTRDPFGFEIPDDEYADYLDRLAEQQRQDATAEAAYERWCDEQDAGLATPADPDLPF